MSASAFQTRPVNQLALQVLRRAKHDPSPNQPAAVQVLRLANDPEAGGVSIPVIPRLEEEADALIQQLNVMPAERAQAVLEAADLDLERLAEARTLPEFAEELLEQLLTVLQEEQDPPAPEQVY